MNDIVADSLDETGPNGGLVGEIDCIEKADLAVRYLVGEIERADCQDFQLAR